MSRLQDGSPGGNDRLHGAADHAFGSPEALPGGTDQEHNLSHEERLNGTFQHRQKHAPDRPPPGQ
jgi:hypothetical protein